MAGQKREARFRADVPAIHVLVGPQQKDGHDKWRQVMNYWLVKSEPSSWSWDQQVAKGAKGEAWTGVRNFTARQNLVNMKKGDKAFYYHSNEGKEIVGIAEII